MHLAIVIESSYRENEQLEELPGAHASAELVSLRLAQAGFVVERVPASREMANYLDERLLGAVTPLDSLIVYYIGYAALNPDRGPALLLDGPRLRAFPASRLSRSIMSAAYSGALIVDAVVVPEPDQTAEQIVVSIADVVPQEGRVSTVVAGREPRDARSWMPSRLSDLLVIALDWLEASEADPKRVTLRSLVDVMQAERICYSLCGVTALRLPEEDFALLPARLAARQSGPVRRVIADNAPPSEPVASWAPRGAPPPMADAPLPSFADAPPSFGDPLPSFADAPPSADPLPSFADAPPSLADPLPSFANASPSFADPLPSFADPGLDTSALAAAGFDAPAPSSATRGGATEPEGDDPSLPDRSSVLPSPAGRRELASHPGRPRDPEVLASLIAEYDRAEQHAEAVAAREELSETLVAEPSRRAYVLEEAARISANRLGDSATAVRLGRRALDIDKTALGALEVVAIELGRSEEWHELAQVYEHVLAELGNGPIAGHIASHLGTILQTRLGDTDGALRAFERALACDPKDPAIYRKLAEVHEGRGETLWAIRRRRAQVKAAPTSADAYAAAVDLFSGAGDVDAAWNAAGALIALDAPDDRARALYDEYRDGGLLRVQRGLSLADWTSGFLDPERDHEVAALFSLVEDAAITLRVDELGRMRALPELPDSARHDPEKSTAMLARSLLWTSKLLGIDAPVLYVVDGAPGHMVPVPAATPTSVVSRSLGSGLALGELSFLWGRHLTFQRNEHQLLTFFSTAQALANLLFALEAIGSGEKRAVDSLDNGAREIAKALRKVLDGNTERELANRVRAMSADRLAERALAWARSVEFVAGRVGLLACGDLTIAASLVARFPLAGILSAKEQTEDLLAYSISAEYGELRSRLGAQVGAAARRAG